MFFFLVETCVYETMVCWGVYNKPYFSNIITDLHKGYIEIR